MKSIRQGRNVGLTGRCRELAGRMALGAERKLLSLLMDTTFRFENLEIWKDAIVVTKYLLIIANKLEDKKLFRFADQLRGAAMSISNNIAEGSGSFSDKDFANFLNIARRSVFECVNILIIIRDSEIISEEELATLKETLNHLSRKVTNFRKTL